MRVAWASTQHPLPFHPNLPHQLLRRMVVGKEQRIADVVQRLAENRKPGGGGGKQRCQSVLCRQSMIGRQREATTSHLLVIPEVRTTAAPPSRLDMVGEDAAHPQRVVPEMR